MAAMGGGISKARAAGIVWTLVALAGCGGQDSPAAAGEPEPGFVSVDNRTPWDLEVAWLGVDDPGAVLIHRVVVAAGQVQTLTREPLPAGTQVRLDLVLRVPVESGPRVRRKADVFVDGDQAVIVQAPPADPFAVEIIGGV